MARTAAKSGANARAHKAKAPSGRPTTKKRPAPATRKAARPAAATKVAVASRPAPDPAPPAKQVPVAGRPVPMPVAPIVPLPPAASGAPAVPASAEEPVKTSVTIETARAIVEAGDAAAIAEHAADLLSGKPTALATGARVLEEVLTRRPEMLVAQIERLVAVIASQHRRAVQTAALALPVMARLSPARVARHLPTLTERFATSSDVAKDGLVATFAALCTASVAYQKRLEPVLELALSTADPAVLQRWAETILPSLKGEPHARARAVVEARLPSIPRAQAQPIAAFLGIKLRPAPSAAR